MSDELSPSEEFQQRQLLALERRAIREGWDIDKDLKDEMIKECATVMREAKNERNKLSAIRNLISMEGQNLQRSAQEAARPATTGDQVIHVHYASDWFHKPTEEQLRELEEKQKKSE